MCDTFFIKKDNKRYFLKNSDRSPNEPNLLEYVPHMTHNEETLKCTYISIPQVKETNEMILVKPSWIWGAEIGMNEYGVSIGNEAVFTKKKNKNESLIGMDYLRLGLERGKTAKEALIIIIDLLKEYGQGGNCGFDHNFYYDNSYLIVDRYQAFCLETSGKHYAYKELFDSYNISNKLSINKDYDEADKEYPNGFEKEHSDFLFTYFSKAKIREQRGKELIKEKGSSLKDMIDILSDHGNNNKENVGSICMHKTLIGDETTASMIVDYSTNKPTVWLETGMTPCLAIYKPYYLGQTSFVMFENSDKLKYTEMRMSLNRLILSNIIDKEKYLELRNSLQESIFKKEEALRIKKAPLAEAVNLSRDSDMYECQIVDLYRENLRQLKLGKVVLKGVYKKLEASKARDPWANKLEERF